MLDKTVLHKTENTKKLTEHSDHYHWLIILQQRTTDEVLRSHDWLYVLSFKYGHYKESTRCMAILDLASPGECHFSVLASYSRRIYASEWWNVVSTLL